MGTSTSFPRRLPVAIFQIGSSWHPEPGRFVELPPGVAGSAAGWVSPRDPDRLDGISVALVVIRDGYPAEQAQWWRLRHDTRTVPRDPINLAIQQAEASGRNLAKRDRLAIEHEVSERLLPGLPVTSRFAHVIRFRDLLIFGACSGQQVVCLADLAAKTWPDAPISRVEWCRQDQTPHPILDQMRARDDQFDGHPQWAWDGRVGLQDGEVHARFDGGDTMAAIMEPACRAMLDEGAQIRSAHLTAALALDVWSVRIDAWSGALSVAFHDQDQDDPEDMASDRIGSLCRFATAWVRLVQDACHETLGAGDQ